MRCATIAVLAAVAGCSASMVQRPGSLVSDPNAPVNEATRPGVIRYLNEGIGAVREKRRADAYAQMRKACAGPYRIDAEGPRMEGAVVVHDGDTSAILESQYWYIQFSCVRTPTPP